MSTHSVLLDDQTFDRLDRLSRDRGRTAGETLHDALALLDEAAAPAHVWSDADDEKMLRAREDVARGDLYDNGDVMADARTLTGE